MCLSMIYMFSLIKEETNRPKYKTLLQHPFIQLHEKLQPYVHPEVAGFVGEITSNTLISQTFLISYTSTFSQYFRVHGKQRNYGIYPGRAGPATSMVKVFTFMSIFTSLWCFVTFSSKFMFNKQVLNSFLEKKLIALFTRKVNFRRWSMKKLFYN